MVTAVAIDKVAVKVVLVGKIGYYLSQDCRCSALPIGVMRSTGVSGLVHRHLLTAYRRRHGRPPPLSPLSYQ